MEDEIWTTQDGRRIKVGDMTEEHVRNALRLVLRRIREGYVSPRTTGNYDPETTVGDGQDELNAIHRRSLADPNVFFPLLEGGTHGSPALQEKYGRR
jgi:hypothetical protein